MPYLFVILSVILMGMDLQAVTLKEALEHAYLHNSSIQAERAQTRGVAEGQSSALSNFLPKLEANIATGERRSHLKSDTVAIINSGKNRDSISQQTVEVTQPILSGGTGYHSLRKAKFANESANARLRAKEQELFLDVVNIYVSLKETQEVAKAQGHYVKNLAQHLDSTRERQKLGDATIADVAITSSKLSLAQSNYKVTLSKVDNYYASFISVVGLEPTNLEEIRVMETLPTGLDEVLNNIQNNPSLQYQIYGMKAARSETDIRKGRLLPIVEAKGSYSRSNSSPYSFVDATHEKVAQLQIRVPLYDGGATYASIREARHSERNAEENIKSVESELQAKATSLWYSLKAYRASMQSTADAVKAAKDYLENVNEEVKHGTKTIINLLEAEQNLRDAKIENIKARNQHLLTYYNLLSVEGDLNVDNLSLDVVKYDPNVYANKAKHKVFGWDVGNHDKR